MGKSPFDRALEFLYGDERSAGLESSATYIPTWLGDIRRYFPRDVVAFLEKDAIENRGLKQLLLEPETLESATRTQAHGEDLVQGYETRFGTGFQLSFPFRPMAGEGSFGHYGSGGSVGFAHEELGISFGYTMNQMRPVYGRDPRTSGLVEALLACLR